MKGPYQVFSFYHTIAFESAGFFKVLSLACSVLWNYCIFENNFCKWRQIHAKTLILVCPTMFFQRPQHQWAHTFKEQCSHVNFLQILLCKALSKPGTSRYQFFAHFAVKKWCTAKWMQAIDVNQHISTCAACWFWRNPELSKTNIR